MKPALRWSEYQQLELIPRSVRQYPTWRDRLQHIYQQAIDRIHPSPIEVWRTYDEAGVWWNAIDHRTGRSIFQASENQLRIWIEQRYLH